MLPLLTRYQQPTGKNKMVNATFFKLTFYIVTSYEQKQPNLPPLNESILVPLKCQVVLPLFTVWKIVRRKQRKLEMNLMQAVTCRRNLIGWHWCTTVKLKNQG